MLWLSRAYDILEEAGTHKSAKTHAGENLASSGNQTRASDALLGRRSIAAAKTQHTYIRSSGGNIAFCLMTDTYVGV